MPGNSLLLITLGAFAFLATALIGFLVGRSRPRQTDLARIAELEGALEQTRTELEASAGEIESAHAEAAATRAGIDAHFDRSAALFGRLAQDYRALFDHWTESAGRLGVSESQAEALIEGVRTQLLADAAPTGDNVAKPASPQEGPSVDDETGGDAPDVDVDANANADADADADAVSNCEADTDTETDTETETETETETNRKAD